MEVRCISKQELLVTVELNKSCFEEDTKEALQSVVTASWF